jgi:hypothetical protein
MISEARVGSFLAALAASGRADVSWSWGPEPDTERRGSWREWMTASDVAPGFAVPGRRCSIPRQLDSAPPMSRLSAIVCDCRYRPVQDVGLGLDVHLPWLQPSPGPLLQSD